MTNERASAFISESSFICKAPLYALARSHNTKTRFSTKIRDYPEQSKV